MPLPITRSLFVRRCAGLTALALVLGVGSLPAQTWVNTGSATTSWSTAANWSGNAVPGAGASLNLAANLTTHQSISLGADRTVSALTAGDSTSPFFTTTLTGNTLTFAGLLGGAANYDQGDTVGAVTIASALSLSTNLTTNVRAGSQTTFSGAVGGSGRLDVNGAGTLILSGNNTFTGGTTIQAGTLQVGTGGTSSALGFGSIINNSNLVFDYSHSFIIANPISGTGSVRLATGSVYLTGNNSYSGTTTISAGTFQVGNGGTSGSLGTGHVLTDSFLVFNRSDDLTVANSISGSGSVSKLGAGALTLSGTNSYSGGTDLYDGTLIPGSSGALSSSGQITFRGGTLQFNSFYAMENSARFSSGSNQRYSFEVADVSALISTALTSADGSLTKLGAGQLILSGNNTYSGTTTISAGTLQIGFAGTTGSLGSGSVVNNAALVFNRSNDLTVANAISGSGSLAKLGAGSLTLTGNNTYAGATTIAAGTLQVGNGGTSGSLGTGAVTNNASLVFSRSNGFTLDNTITGSGSVTFLSGASVGIVGNNSYTGPTTVSGIIVQIGDGGTSGSLGLGNIINQGALQFVRSDSFVVSNPISGSGLFFQLGSGTLSLTGANSSTGTTTVSAGTLQIGNGGTTGSVAGSITNHANLSFNRSDATTHAGVISGSGSVVVTNPGGAGNYLRLSGANTYAGGTTLTAGSSILLGHASGLGTGPVTLQENSILFASSYGINLTQLTTPASAASAIVTTSGGYVYDSAAAGSVAVRLQGSTTGLTKSGPGTLTLTGANSYTGTTTISAGTLQVGNGGNTGSLGFDSVTNHAALAFNRSNALTVGNKISGSGSISQLGAGTLTLTAANTYSGGTTVSAGTLKVANFSGSALGSGQVTVASGATLTGTGSFTGALNVAGTVAPGNSPGTLSAGPTTFAPGGTYIWEINNATGSAGTAYDLLSITGSLNITATSGSPFAINVTSLLANNTAGQVINFNSAQNYAYTIATASSGLTGFSASAFTLNTAGFSNPLNGGTWSLAAHGNNLDLTFTASAIPEPSTYAALLGLSALALAAHHRKNRSRSS